MSRGVRARLQSAAPANQELLGITDGTKPVGPPSHHTKVITVDAHGFPHNQSLLVTQHISTFTTPIGVGGT